MAKQGGVGTTWLVRYLAAAAVVLTSTGTTRTVLADKDDSYYMAGSGNPNVNQKMYWKDAENVLQDLSQFKALYVEFSHCAWTWMQMEEADNDVDENDYWYMGKIPPMGANVAYSLYGALKGQSSFEGCNGNTFINSFYTNTGFQDYAKAMYHAGQSGFSNYAYDDDYSGGVTAACGGGYGVGCDATYGFAMHTYSTDTCDPKYVTGVSDSLSSLNSAMQKTTCVKIYDSSSSGYNNRNYNNNNYNNNNYNNGDDSFKYSGTALELLYYSSACFYQNYYSPDGECPDPYGKISFYRQNFAKGLQRQRKEQPYVIYTSEVEKGKTMVAIGSLLLGVAIVVIFAELIASKNYRVKHKRIEEERSDGLVKPGNDRHKPMLKTAPVPIAEPNVMPMPMPKLVPPPVAKPIATPVPKLVPPPVAKPIATPVPKPVAQAVAKPVATPVARSVAQPVAKPEDKAVSDEQPYDMLASMKQRANREMIYRMAIFNGNVERIRNGVMRVCSWEKEPTSPDETPVENALPPSSAQVDSYPAGQHMTPFTQITPSPLPSQDDSSLPMATANNAPNKSPAVNVSQLIESSTATAANPPPVSQLQPQEYQAPQQATTGGDAAPDSMYDNVIMSRASMDQNETHEPSVELTASASATGAAKDDSNVANSLKASSQDEADIYPAHSRESIGDLSNASSARVDRYLAAKMDAALLDNDDRPSMDVILQSGSAASLATGGGGTGSSPSGGANAEQAAGPDTEAVLVTYEDADVPPSSSCCS